MGRLFHAQFRVPNEGWSISMNVVLSEDVFEKEPPVVCQGAEHTAAEIRSRLVYVNVLVHRVHEHPSHQWGCGSFIETSDTFIADCLQQTI